MSFHIGNTADELAAAGAERAANRLRPRKCSGSEVDALIAYG
jgi:hypothetical protein